MRDLEDMSAIAVDCGLRIHKALGPGLLESVYETVLATWLEREGLKIERQRQISFEFDGLVFKDAFRIDILVEDRLIIEVKSVETLTKVHGKQLLTYLRLMQQPLGLLMNFGGATFKDGLRRIVNDHQNFASSRLRVNQSKVSGLKRTPETSNFFDGEPLPDFSEVNEKYDENGRWIP
jgi:GxxExxY protein